MTIVLAAHAHAGPGARALAEDLHFPPRGIECDSGVKQHGNASTPPKDCLAWAAKPLAKHSV